MSRPPAHEQQVRDVGAGDEQEAAHGGEHDHYAVLEPRIDAIYRALHAPVGGLRPVRVRPLGHRGSKLAQSCVSRRTRSQTRVADRGVLRTQVEWQPNLRRFLDTHRECKVARGDTDDRSPYAVDSNHGTVGVARAAESRLPETVADHRDWRCSSTRVVSGECTTSYGRDPQHVQQRRGNARPGQNIVVRRVVECGTDESRGREILERARSLFQAAEHRRGKVERFIGIGRRSRSEANDAITVGEWQRGEQQVVDDTEDRRVRANPNREREHRDRREHRRSTQRAPRVPAVLEQRVETGGEPNLPRFFAHGRLVAHRLAYGFGSEPSPLGVRRDLLPMEGELLSQLVLVSSEPHPISDAARETHERTQGVHANRSTA